MAKHGSLNIFQRYIYYPLCGVLLAALALTLFFVFRRLQMGETLKQRGIEHYRQGQYEAALKEFLLALQCDANLKEAHTYKELCYQRLAPNPDVAKVQEYLRSDNPDMQLFGLELAIERNLRGAVADIGPLARSKHSPVREAAGVALRVLRTSTVRVKCLVCERDATVIMEPGQRFPVRCPHCGQFAARALWYCNKCGHLWVPTSGAAWKCPECGSPNVGGAPISRE